MKNLKNITNDSFITSILSSPPQRTLGNTATLIIPPEGNQPVKTFYVKRQGKHKAGSRLPGTLLRSCGAVSPRTSENTNKIGNFGMIKSPKEVPPDERSEYLKP